MKNFEPVYKELENLFINKLPEYIEKINKEHNDRIILKPFENKSLEENCINTPSFSFKFEETEYEEKDRIIENTVYTISIEIKLQQFYENQIIVMWRYIEAIQRILEENSNYKYQIMNLKSNRIFIKIEQNSLEKVHDYLEKSLEKVYSFDIKSLEKV